MGPYHAYWEQFKDQVKVPLRIAFNTAKNAINDMWLLVTNPTEWYTKQQLVNVRPEKPISFPMALEVTLFDALPPSVPASTQGKPSTFTITSVIKNEGDMDVRNINAIVECKKSCEPKTKRPDSVTDAVSMKKGESAVLYFTGLKASVKQSGKEAETELAKLNLNITYTYATNSSLLVEVISSDERNRRFRDRGDVFKNVIATEKVSPAKLSLNVGPQPLVYDKDQASAIANTALLLISVSSNRDDGRVILRKWHTNYDNNPDTRSYGKIYITLPNVVGKELQCGLGGTKSYECRKPCAGLSESECTACDKCMVEQISICKEKPPEQLGNQCEKITKEPGTDIEISKSVEKYACKLQNDYEIKPYDFNSIFAFMCSFKVAELPGAAQTGLITAELPAFEYKITKEKSVPITAPLGILFDPQKEECTKCGQGRLNACDKEECHNIPQTYGSKCWFDSKKAGVVEGTAQKLVGRDACTSCGPTPNCGQFTEKADCEEESKWCGFSCVFDESAPFPGAALSGTTKKGACVSAAAAAPAGHTRP